MKPKFKHDCDSCIFLGCYEDYDLYFCPSGGIIEPTVISRYGDDGPNYLSGIKFATDGPLYEAKKRAINLKLLKDE